MRDMSSWSSPQFLVSWLKLQWHWNEINLMWFMSEAIFFLSKITLVWLMSSQKQWECQKSSSSYTKSRSFCGVAMSSELQRAWASVRLAMNIQLKHSGFVTVCRIGVFQNYLTCWYLCLCVVLLHLHFIVLLWPVLWWGWNMAIILPLSPGMNVSSRISCPGVHYHFSWFPKTVLLRW